MEDDKSAPDVDSGRGSSEGHDSSSHRNGDSVIISSPSDERIPSFQIPSIPASSLNDISFLISSRDTTTSRMRYELRHGNHPHGADPGEYFTPFQRKEREVKDLRKEMAQLLKERDEREAETASLKKNMAAYRKQVREEFEEEIATLTEKLRVSESSQFTDKEALCQAQDELTRMDEQYTSLKQQMSEKEEKFEEYLQVMYKKGQQAAMFEREEELEMLASNKNSRVSLRELTRKLSKTETELAKWQGLKLDESYAKTERPETQADVTLSFLKDAFFHFLCDSSGNEDHLRAMLKIFKYSDVQMGKISKGLDEFKHLDKKKLAQK